METKARVDMQKIPRCTAADIGITAREGTAGSNETLEACNEYFRAFSPPSEKCYSCGVTLGGLQGFFCGGFSWGLVHGEGACGCGWPCRAYHRPKDSDGEIFDRAIVMILQYHPSEVTSRGADERNNSHD